MSETLVISTKLPERRNKLRARPRRFSMESSRARNEWAISETLKPQSVFRMSVTWTSVDNSG